MPLAPLTAFEPGAGPVVRNWVEPEGQTMEEAQEAGRDSRLPTANIQEGRGGSEEKKRRGRLHPGSTLESTESEEERELGSVLRKLAEPEGFPEVTGYA